MTAATVLEAAILLTVRDPAQVCRPAAADVLRIVFAASDDLATMVAWSKRVVCVEYTFDAALAGRRVGQPVDLEVKGADASAALQILFGPMNLRVEGRGATRRIVATGPERAPEPPVAAAPDPDRARQAEERAARLGVVSTMIHKVDDTHYTITREVMKHLARDGWPPARIVPEVKDEKPIGIRIFGVKPDSLLAAVGLQNGDRLEAWNGLALTKPEAVAEAFVNSADHARVRIALNRRGAPVTVEWEITDAPRTRAAVRR